MSLSPEFMSRTDAYRVLTLNGFTGPESSRILDTAMAAGIALTVPRTLPSLHVDTDPTGLTYRIMINDTGVLIILP